MLTSLLLILLAIAILIILYLLNTRSSRSQNPQTKRKEENKDTILTLLREQESVTNNDIEKLLGVSDATATRYLEELEKEQKIVQIGTTGQGVHYVLK